MLDPRLLISHVWVPGRAEPLVSIDPALEQPVWEGAAASDAQVDDAVTAAADALASWSTLPWEQRRSFVEAFAGQLRKCEGELASLITRETGKPAWESAAEVQLMIAKAPTSIDAYQQRCAPLQADVGAGAKGIARFKPHGVVAVFGPFNMPGHLPNGHIIPALLAGNTLVFKPSELTPAVGQKMIECWLDAGLPRGVINLVQGGQRVGQRLAAHPDISGLFFTGGTAAGSALIRATLDQPWKILALEMGGNNPLMISQVSDLDAAAHLTILSAYISSGQRCSCARRLILPAGAEGDQLLERLQHRMNQIRVGLPSDQPEPFMGPLISAAAADKMLAAQEDLIARGATPLVAMRRHERCRALLSPGLLDVTLVGQREDVEHFGPLLQVIRVADEDAGIDECNRTAYGLCAALLSDSAQLYERFFQRVRAGVINWNRQTTGASGKLPFGGVGASGNFRPSGFFAVDYSAYPVASIESPTLKRPSSTLPGLPH